ncbi:hypothetical protein AB6A40_003742 [Gnathostoma spinigerum]|uniref:Uncharacterized protein n=1 Tax=Gnathostoma spinigerum TaxID=75299 RepID=A0ABD6EAF7_9BILA
MHYAGAHVLAWTLLLLGTGCLLVAASTNYWSIHQPYESTGIMTMNRGLWKQCQQFLLHTECTNRFTHVNENVASTIRYGVEVLQDQHRSLSVKGLQFFEWMIIAEILISIWISAVILVYSPCCCNHCNCCISIFVFLAGIISACGCTWYTHQNQMGETMTLNILHMDDVPLYKMFKKANDSIEVSVIL